MPSGLTEDAQVLLCAVSVLEVLEAGHVFYFYSGGMSCA